MATVLKFYCGFRQEAAAAWCCVFPFDWKLLAEVHLLPDILNKEPGIL